MRPVQIEGRTAREIVAAFAAAAQYAKTGGLTLRRLSSRCFWGHSKFLDSREDLLRALYPDLQLLPRPVLAHVCLPEAVKGVLFIENQDTYSRAITGVPIQVENLALVYVAGYRGSAQRVRERDGVQLHYCGHPSEVVRCAFEQWWFSGNEGEWPLHSGAISTSPEWPS